MEKSFNEYYLTESAKEYKFKLKLAVPELTAEQKDRLEVALQRYDLRSLGTFKETPIQESPLDFPNVKNTKVFISELVLGYPATIEMLRLYVSEKTGVNEQSVAIYNENDPRETYTQQWLERMSPEYKASYKPYLGSDPEPTEVPEYGEAYNKKFLDQLKKERDEREMHVVENPLSPKQTIDNKDLHGEMPTPPTSFSILGNRKRT